MKTQTAGFRVSGEFVTQHARNLVVEGDWQEALRFLTISITGLDHEKSVAILCGEKRLVGTNSLQLKRELKEVQQELAEKLRQQFSGIVRERTCGSPSHWRPYAVVTSWCQEDLPPGNMQNPWHRSGDFTSVPANVSTSGQIALLAWSLARNVYYMDNPGNDRAIVGHDNLPVLWKLVSDPPIWWTPCRTFAEGLAEYTSVFGKLHERGAEHLTSRTVERLFRESGESEPVVEVVAVPGELLTDLASKITGQPEELSGTDQIMKVLREGYDLESPVEVGDLKADHGYIARDGKFYDCPYYTHKALAYRICKQFYNREEDDPEQVLEHEIGFVRITVSKLDGKPYMFCDVRLRSTKAQQKTGLDWCVVHMVPPSDFHWLRPNEQEGNYGD